MESMTSSTTQAVPAIQVPHATPRIFTTIDNVVLLVWLVKSMREMGCKPYMGEQDAKIARRWIKNVEKTMI